MERLTTGTLPASLPPPFPTFMADRRYDNRLEAARHLRRNTLNQAMLRDGVAGECVAVLFDVSNHWSRELPKRLGEPHRAHHDLKAALHATRAIN
jgi:metal-responsive CopG/Arc/MetJ family transcriptional regulator